MPNYVLDTSATQVNTAINNVVNAQTTPSNGSSLMVTSDGIYQALNNIQHTNFNTGTLVTSTDTIASNNSDTQIPTTQAVASYLASKVVPTITQFQFASASSSTQTSTLTYRNTVSGGGVAATLLSNVITTPATGTSFLQFMGDIHAINREDYPNFTLKINGSTYYTASGATDGRDIIGLNNLTAGDEITVTYRSDSAARTSGSIFIWNYGI